MVFVNSDVVTDKVSRTDLTAYYIPCSQIADEVGNPKVSNMVMLGAYVAGTKVLKAETIEKMIQEMFTGAKAKFVPLNGWHDARHRPLCAAGRWIPLPPCSTMLRKFSRA